MAINDEDKEKVRQATSIVDLVSAVTTVKRSGRNQMAVCPFHQEKTPSMSLDVARGLYYCHGCHAKGDVFTFVQETQGLTFPEALEVLARQAGIVLTHDPGAERRRGRRQALIDAVGEAVEFYHRVLMKADEAGQARAYLRGRGYGADTVADFKLGYAPDGGDRLVRELRARNLPDPVMIDAGLARRGRSGPYDYFRDRILFPTWDVRGDPVGFGGRVLGDGQPKYLNTPETMIYKKSHLLYGLDRARREIQRAGYAVVVEGYTDVISLHRAGVPQAVATNGTALGDDHFELLRRFADRIVLAFDADAAGGRAALRGDELSVPVDLDLDLRVAEMPAGVDPAEMVQAGRVDEIEQAVLKARPLLQFRLERELAGYDLSEPESRARALRSLAPRVARVTDDLARMEYTRFLAERLGVDLGSVEHAMGRRSGRARQAARQTTSGAQPSGRSRLEAELLKAVLDDGGAAHRAGVGSETFVDERYRKAFRLIEPELESCAVGSPVPLPSGDSEEVGLLVEVAMSKAPSAPIDDVMTRLRRVDLEGRIAELRGRLEHLDPDGEEYSAVFEELIRWERAKRDHD